MTDEFIEDHPYQGMLTAGASCQHMYDRMHPLEVVKICGRQAMDHAAPGPTGKRHLLNTHSHSYVAAARDDGHCAYHKRVPAGDGKGLVRLVCGYPEHLHTPVSSDVREQAEAFVQTMMDLGPTAQKGSQLVRLADVAQYARPPMPDAARKGIVVTLIDAPEDPLGTLAVIGGIYSGRVARSKYEVTDEQRRGMLADMRATVLDGPLEAIQFTFLVEGADRALTHQAVRNRFAFFAQESLRFAVAEDWAQEVPLPPSLRREADDSSVVGIWRKALNQAEDAYAALVAIGMPAEEARGVLPHAITTRYYWTVSLRTLLQEAGKRTCTQAQFPWRELFSGVAKALREQVHSFAGSGDDTGGYCDAKHDQDHWQYVAFADLIRPVCYQTGGCGFMAKFDRGCTIRERVDANEKLGRPSSEWATDSTPLGNPGQKYDGKGRLIARAINPAEWAADPAAARVYEKE